MVSIPRAETKRADPLRGIIVHLTFGIGMSCILSVSRNTRLLLSRNDALGMAGFAVVSPRTPRDAPTLALQRHVDAVVIGHSVLEPERSIIIEEIRQLRPRCPIFFVCARPNAGNDRNVDASIDVSDGTEPLGIALQKRLSGTASVAE